jgi:hypothetical protein
VIGKNEIHKRIEDLVETHKIVEIVVAQNIRSFHRLPIEAENSTVGRSKSRTENGVYTGHNHI